MTDFLKFKEIILDYKLYKEGDCCDLSDGLIVTSLNSRPSDKNDGENNDTFGR